MSIDQMIASIRIKIDQRIRPTMLAMLNLDTLECRRVKFDLM